MIFAKRVFFIAAVLGVIVLAPQYFMEAKVGRDFPPPITHPEHFYGFIGVALAWQMLRWPAIAYRFTSYVVDDAGLEIARGVYWRTITNVPKSRIQHSDVSQGPLERKHGLGTLVVYTAGTQHSEVKLPGLEFATAQRIRAHLLPRDEGDAV